MNRQGSVWNSYPDKDRLHSATVFANEVFRVAVHDVLRLYPVVGDAFFLSYHPDEDIGKGMLWLWSRGKVSTINNLYLC